MAQLDGVEKSGDYGSLTREKAAVYYYNAYVALSSVVYRANLAGEYVYYTGEAPQGATDIVIVKRSV